MVLKGKYQVTDRATVVKRNHLSNYIINHLDLHNGLFKLDNTWFYDLEIFNPKGNWSGHDLEGYRLIKKEILSEYTKKI